MRYGVPLFVFLFLIAPRACAQEPPPPAGLRAFFCSIEPKPATSWERWQRWKRPKKLFLPPPQFDYGMTQPLVTPSTPEDDPFAKHMKVYNSEVYFFGVSGARGFNLRNWPRSWAGRNSRCRSIRPPTPVRTAISA